MAMMRMPRRRIASRQIEGACGDSALCWTASRPHGPLTSTSSHADTCEAVADTGSSARHRRLCALAPGFSQERSPLRRRGVGRPRDGSRRRDRRRVVRARSGPVDRSTSASRAYASAGMVSVRSPSPSSTRPSEPVSHSSGPGVTSTGVSSSTAGGWSGRSRVAGCLRHTSVAIHRRIAGVSRRRRAHEREVGQPEVVERIDSPQRARRNGLVDGVAHRLVPASAG